MVSENKKRETREVEFLVCPQCGVTVDANHGLCTYDCPEDSNLPRKSIVRRVKRTDTWISDRLKDSHHAR